MTPTSAVLDKFADPRCRMAEFSGWQHFPIVHLQRRGLVEYKREWSWALKRWRYLVWPTAQGRAEAMERRKRRNKR